MTHRTSKIRPATTAIAAVLALSSTQLLAQTAPDAVQPVTVAPVTTVMDSAPVVTTPSEPLTTSTSTSDPLAPSAKSTATKSTKSATTHRTASVVRPAKAAPPVAQAPVAAPVAAPVETVEAAPIMVTAAPAAPAVAAVATPPAQNASVSSSGMLPIAGAAGLGFLGLLGVGLAMRRRKRRNEEEFAAAEQDELAVEAPAQTDPLFDEPAFAPLSADPALALGAAVDPAESPSDCVDAAPGSHVEAACEGPTADNPSLSIKKRLKRAHFFDQREFLAAAGEVAPMATDAGLPDAITEPVAAPALPTREPA